MLSPPRNQSSLGRSPRKHFLHGGEGEKLFYQPGKITTVAPGQPLRGAFCFFTVITDENLSHLTRIGCLLDAIASAIYESRLARSFPRT